MKKGRRYCEMDSPMYRQILKEVNQGYEFIACDKTHKIVRRKKSKA